MLAVCTTIQLEEEEGRSQQRT